MWQFRGTMVPCWLALTSIVSGCGGGGGGGGVGTPPQTTAIAQTSGDGQAGRVGQTLSDPLQVVVTEGGSAVAGETVTWSVTAGGGSIDPGSGLTGADGFATATWTLGPTAGNQTARATLSGAAGSPVSFTASATPDAPTTLLKAGGDNQTGQVNATLTSQVQAKVADQFGNGVAGIDVTWNATGANVSAAVIPTNGSGVSPVTVTLGPAEGPVTITASSDALSGSPLTFNATATPAPSPSTTISVINNSFTPSTLTVPVGSTVTWSWAASAVQHNVNPDQAGGEPRPSGALVNGPHTYQYTFNNPGTFRYFCANHGAPGGVGMSGTITVQ
jgi:plastocyanin